MLSINNNRAAYNAAATLFKISKQLEDTQNRLATGKKINNAEDNPAGMVIAKQLQSQIAGVEQAMSNTERGKSLVKTAEKSLETMHDLLEKAKKLTLDNLNSATSSEAKAANQTEINNIVQSLSRIAQNTKYGSTNLLDGTFTSMRFQLGGEASEFVNFSITNMNTSAIGQVSSNAYSSLAALNGLNAASASYGDVLGVIEDAINDITTERGRLGAFITNTLDTNFNSLKLLRDELSKSKGVIEDADMAEESVKFNKQTAQYQLAMMTLQQSNQRSGLILNLFS